MERIAIDDDAKLRVYLNRIDKDANGKPFYVGKLQFPGEINFERGASFMVFTAERGHEEIQISPVDPTRRSKSKRSGVALRNGRVIIDLKPFLDSNDEIVYVGEAQGVVKTDCTHGVFFTVFTSRDGSEEIQIGRLDHSQGKQRKNGFREKPDYRREEEPASERRARDSYP
jgi:hypothetical protein